MPFARPVEPSLLRWLRASSAGIAAFEPHDDADWRALLADAEREGLAPLLYNALMRSPAPQMPAGVRATLAESAARTAARNLLLSAELRALLQAAQARGLTCVPVRGVALSEQLYGTPALRPTGDIDVLVRREELAGVRALLAERELAEVEARPGFAEAFDYTLTFCKRGGLLVVEPHWTIGYPPLGDRVNMAAVWSRCVAGTAVGIPALSLGPEDLLLHLCLHLVHHRRAAPHLWFYELHRFIRSQSLDWALVCRVAREASVSPLVSSVLGEIAQLFETPIPASALDELEHARLTRSERLLARWLTDASRGKGRERLAVWLGTQGLGRKLRYALSFLFPSLAFIRQQYGVAAPWQVGRTYVARLCELAWRGVQGLWSFSRCGDTARDRRGDRSCA